MTAHDEPLMTQLERGESCRITRRQKQVNFNFWWKRYTLSLLFLASFCSFSVIFWIHRIFRIAYPTKISKFSVTLWKLFLQQNELRRITLQSPFSRHRTIGLFVCPHSRPRRARFCKQFRVIIETDKTKHFNDFFSQFQTRISHCGIPRNFVCRRG